MTGRWAPLWDEDGGGEVRWREGGREGSKAALNRQDEEGVCVCSSRAQYISLVLSLADKVGGGLDLGGE